MSMSFAWQPQEGPQLDAILATWCEELFFGGAMGGGKSDYLLGDYLQDVEKYGEHWRGILFRKTYDELEELQSRAEEIFIPTGGQYKAVKRTWVWPKYGNATLKMRYLERAKDYTRYQGHQYAWIGWDELPNWGEDKPYNMLTSRLRTPQMEIPTKRIRSSGNPGGRGHYWVKPRFIDHAPTGYIARTDEATGRDIMFIPSKVSDNKILLKNDPEYINRLRGSGSEALVKMWLDGDWNAVLGAYFDNFGMHHVLPPFTIPDSWTRFRSFDWGSASPFSVGWYAVANGEQPDLSHFPADKRFYVPKGALILYREWYGASGPNEGLKLQNAEIARGIVQRSGNEKYAYSVADPAIFAENGGESIAETMLKNGVLFRPADNQRVAGWQQCRSRLDGMDGMPMFYVFSTCADFIRTIPSQQHSETNPEDLDTTAEDHVADCWRYACMSRPWAKTPKGSMVERTPGGITFNEAMKLGKKERKRRRR